MKRQSRILGLVALTMSCHGAPVPHQQQQVPVTPRAAPQELDASCAGISISQPAPSELDATVAEPPTPGETAPPIEPFPVYGNDAVTFHVVNETGVDVYVNEGDSLTLEMNGKVVDVRPGCGAMCPNCACKECPYYPPKFRRIPNRSSWIYGWRRDVYIARNCGSPCPCLIKSEAKAGRYTVEVSGVGKAAAREPKKVQFEEPSPNGPHIECKAKATFQLQPGARVELRFDCIRN